MARSMGWRREGSKRRFRYVDAAGRPITDEAKLERIDSLAIPPAWKDVWIAPTARSKLQATGRRRGGAQAVPLPPGFPRPAGAGEVRQADPLRRAAAAAARGDGRAHGARGLPPERVAAIAVRLINLGWFRVGTERYAKESRTFGITTLRKRHVTVRGSRISLQVPRQAQGDGPQRGRRRRARRRDAGAARACRARGVFQFEADGRLLQPRRAAPERLRPGVHGRGLHREGLPHVGRHADSPRSSSPSRASRTARPQAKKAIAAVMRQGRRRSSATRPAVARSSYVSPAVVEQYLDGRTIEDFRPRHLRVVGARDTGLDAEETGDAQPASLVANSLVACGRLISD